MRRRSTIGYGARTMRLTRGAPRATWGSRSGARAASSAAQSVGCLRCCRIPAATAAVRSMTSSCGGLRRRRLPHWSRACWSLTCRPTSCAIVGTTTAQCLVVQDCPARITAGASSRSRQRKGSTRTARAWTAGAGRPAKILPRTTLTLASTLGSRPRRRAVDTLPMPAIRYDGTSSQWRTAMCALLRRSPQSPQTCKTRACKRRRLCRTGAKKCCLRRCHLRQPQSRSRSSHLLPWHASLWAAARSARRMRRSKASGETHTHARATTASCSQLQSHTGLHKRASMAA